jgi:hypothetical protein
MLSETSSDSETEEGKVIQVTLDALVLAMLDAGYSIDKQTPWPLVRKRTIPTERPPLVGEI